MVQFRDARGKLGKLRLGHGHWACCLVHPGLVTAASFWPHKTTTAYVPTNYSTILLLTYTQTLRVLLTLLDPFPCVTACINPARRHHKHDSGIISAAAIVPDRSDRPRPVLSLEQASGSAANL